MSITTVGLDADDTLWHNETIFRLTQDRFVSLLGAHAEEPAVREHLAAVERRNLSLYGYGVKGFTLSMIETAIDVTDGKVPGHVIGQILDAGREMLRHPIESMPHAEATLAALGKTHKLILITKGDLFDQERKLAASGLGDYFDAVEIVSDKSASAYERIFTRHADGPAHALMVGNSLASDVVPALDAGAWGVHVPSGYNWELDHHDGPADTTRFRLIRDLGELPPLIAEIG